MLLSLLFSMSLGSCVLYTVPFDCLPEEDMQLAWLDMRVDLTSRTLGLNVKVRKLPLSSGHILHM